MNASLTNLNSVNPVQAQSAAGKSQDSTSGTPFSQVLSSEIAQNRRSSETQKDDIPDPGVKDSASTAGPADASAADAVKADDPQDAAASDPAPGTAIPVSAETFLALGLNPDGFKSAPTHNDDAVSEGTAVHGANIQFGRDTKKDLPSRMPQTVQLATEITDPLSTEKADPLPTEKADPLSTAKTGLQKPDAALAGKAVATAFSAQLAAAQPSDSIKTAEPPSDLMSHSLMRTTPQASVETPTPLSGASANRLAPSIGAAAWGQALGEKIVWMAAGAQQTASLTLNPPNMGPLQIVLNISNDQATASFFSAQPEVRQALEAAFPRLREMMSEAGIQLGQATVSADTPQQNAPDPRSQRAALPFPDLDETSAGGLPLSQPPALQSGRGLIDTFA